MFAGDAILAALANSAERLLLAPDWREAVDDVLRHLGTAAAVSRAYLIRVDPPASQDGCHATQLAELCAPGVSSQFSNPTLQGASLARASFTRWIELMSARRIVHGLVRDLPTEERAELARQVLLSIAAFRVFVDGGWWAFVGVDDCMPEREWSDFELDSLRAAANMIGAAEQVHRSESRRLGAEVRYQQLIEQNPAVTHTGSHDPEDGRLSFVSLQFHELLGYRPVPSCRSRIAAGGGAACTRTTSPASSERTPRRSRSERSSTRSTACGRRTGRGRGSGTRLVPSSTTTAGSSTGRDSWSA